ncbi:MAG: hypothetical protein M0015_13030 [Betaproteobacteria bacterium]|nr:hypothetical protein [Betaproteobacteria bacterium]
MSGEVIDVSRLASDRQAYAGPLHMVVKSLDQVERRARLVEAKQRGRIGRIAERPIATGLWARVASLGDHRIDRSTAQVTEFREPRGLVQIAPDRYLLAEVSSVLLVDAGARVERRYAHPFFAFLHSLSFDSENGRFLVVSSGYDCLIEMDLEGRVSWEWFAWEHGFNPSLDGVYLCRSEALAQRCEREGKKAVLVEPAKLGELGLMTSQRSNHPNSACYHPSDRNRVLATLGHSGEVIEIDRPSGRARTVISGLEAMPHGIQPCGPGWLVTNTLHGEFWLLDGAFNVQTRVVTRNLPGKPEEMAQHEWLQAAYPVRGGVFVAADANRGLIAIDLNAGSWQIHAVDESWCVHHLVVPS